MAPGVTILVMPDQGEVADDPQGRDYVESVDVGILVQTVIGHEAKGGNYDNQMLC